jgi:hypothetical protein
MHAVTINDTNIIFLIWFSILPTLSIPEACYSRNGSPVHIKLDIYNLIIKLHSKGFQSVKKNYFNISWQFIQWTSDCCLMPTQQFFSYVIVCFIIMYNFCNVIIYISTSYIIRVSCLFQKGRKFTKT